MDVEKVLIEWGFQNYIERFRDEEITWESFIVMNDDTLKSVVPKAGPRSVMLSKLKAINHSTGLSFESDSTFGSVSEVSPSCPHTVISSTPSRVQNASILENETLVECKHEDDKDPLINNLRDILKAHPVGSALLSVRTLDVGTRNLLTDVVASHLLSLPSKPTRRDYTHYADAIVAMFPDEQVATYYIPSVNQETPKGKLYFKVVNLIRKRTVVGGDQTQLKRKKCCGDNDKLAFLDDLSADDESDTSEMIAWLQVHASPESKVLDYWSKTARIRLGFIHSPEAPPVHVILQQWARYADENGHLLINQDFSLMHKQAADKFCAKWMSVHDALLRRLDNVKDKRVKETLLVLRDDSATPELRMYIALVLLPWLLPESSVATLASGKGKRRAFWKPSCSESVQHFVDIQEPGLDMEAHLARKAGDLEKRAYSYSHTSS